MSDQANIRISEDDKSITVVGTDSMNLTVAPELDNALRGAVASGKQVFVDFRATHFIDSAIIQNIIDAAQAMAMEGRRLSVILQPGSHPRYVLRLTGVDALVDMLEDDSPVVQGN